MAEKNSIDHLFNLQDLCKAVIAQNKHDALDQFDKKVFFFMNTPCASPALCPNIELMSVFLNTLNTTLFTTALNQLGCNLQEICFTITQEIGFVEHLKTFVLKGQYLIDLYLAAINQYISENGRCQHRHYINRAKAFIEKNITTTFTLEDVANDIFISPTYLSTLFNNLTGSTYSSYVTSARVDLAKRLLISSDLSINDIAVKCGFNQASYFATAFKKAVGITPKQFRVSMSA